MNMKLKKPRSCKGCRWYIPYDSTHGFCLYHFETEKIKPILWIRYTTYEDIVVDIKPKNSCPKPRTIQESLFWQKYGEKNLGLNKKRS